MFGNDEDEVEAPLCDDNRYTAQSPEVKTLHITAKDRIVTSLTPLELRLEVVPQPTEARYRPKPFGLWYACGRAWMEWTYNQRWCFGFEHVQRLHLDTSRLLRIVTADQLTAFDAAYSDEGLVGSDDNDYVVKAARRFNFGSIDWPRVAERYAGIEICPYQWKHRHSMMWYYPWDVASGCIWDTSIVRRVEALL